MLNALTVDVEDWFCAHNLGIGMPEWSGQEQRIERNILRILALLKRHELKATFFVLGWIAEHYPDLVREIGRRGHEIATHGYAHLPVTEMTPEEFEKDLVRALEVTSANCRQPILGYRAPSFTITRRTTWALEILARNGIRYDSSIYPVGFHPRYGIADAPLAIHRVDSLLEVPLSCALVLGRRIPCSGGAYFRLTPYPLTRFLMRRSNNQGRPVVFYFHPWEIDPGQPRRNLPLGKRIRHYTNLAKTESRLQRLFRDFRFAPLKELLEL